MSHPKISSSTYDRVIENLKWWEIKLESWGSEAEAGGEYPIRNGQELLSNQGWIEILQSDASGTDGFGYIWSTLEEENGSYSWYASQWGLEVPSQSHEAELRALHHFIRHRTHSSKLIVWVSDSEFACWTINKGHCKDPKAYVLLEELFLECERITVQVIALWVPREQNRLTDYLSHFAMLMDRVEVEGSSKEFASSSSFEDH